MLCQVVMFCRCKLKGRKKSLQTNFPFQEIVKQSFFHSKVSGLTRFNKSRHRNTNQTITNIGPVYKTIKIEGLFD